MAKDELDPNFFKNQVLIVVKEYLEENKEDYTSGGIEPEQIKGIVQGAVSEALKFIPKYVDQSLAAKLGKAQGIDSSKVFEMVGQATSGMEARILSQVQKEMYGALGNVIQKCENAAQEHKSAAEGYNAERERLLKTVALFEGKLGVIVQAEVGKAMNNYTFEVEKRCKQLEEGMGKFNGLEEKILNTVRREVGKVVEGIPKPDELSPRMKVEMTAFMEASKIGQITKDLLKEPVKDLLENDFESQVLVRKISKSKIGPYQESPDNKNDK